MKLILKAVFNKKNSQTNFSLSKKNLPKKIASNLINLKELKLDVKENNFIFKDLAKRQQEFDEI